MFSLSNMTTNIFDRKGVLVSGALLLIIFPYRMNYYSPYTNSNNALFIDVTNFSILQHRCDVIDFGQTLLYEMCKMRYLTGKTSILLQISRVFLMFRS